MSTFVPQAQVNMEQILQSSGPLVETPCGTSFDHSIKTDVTETACEQEILDEPRRTICNQDSWDFIKEVGQISWPKLFWECVKGFPSFLRFKRKPRTIQVTMKRRRPDTYETAYITKVYVWSNKKDSAGRHVVKHTQCMFDTGNLVGNFASKAFLIEELGFQESDFNREGLTEAEKSGEDVSGHPVVPEGWIELTWYPPNCPMPYRNMRFLVLENPKFELAICARTIEKHRILSKPFDLVTSHPGALDPEHERLDGIRDKHQNDLQTLRGDLADAKEATPVNSKTVASLERMIKRKEQEVTKATENLKAHDLKVTASRSEPSSRNRINPQPPSIIQPITSNPLVITSPRRTTTGFSVQSGPISTRVAS